MRKLYYFIICMFTCMFMVFASCKPTQTVTEDTYNVSIQSMLTLKPDTLNALQLDSLVNADNLPLYTKWQKTYIRDAESQRAYEYGVLIDTNAGMIYTVKVLSANNTYVIQKKHISIK